MEETFTNVCHCLMNVLQGDETIRNNAEQQLNNYFRSPGFHPLLQNIIQGSNYDFVLKQSAVMMFSRLIKTYWEEKNGYVINNEEKNQIRGALLSILTVTDNMMISGNIVDMLSHIIFVDFPTVWPNAFHQLAELLAVDNLGQKQRILLLIYRALKTIARKPEVVDYGDPQGDVYLNKKENLQEICTEIFSTISTLWANSSTQMLSSLSSYLQGTIEEKDLQKDLGMICKFSLKAMHVIFKYFYSYFGDRNPTVCVEFFKVVLQHLNSTIDCRVALENKNTLFVDYVEKSILNYLKLVNDSQDNHPLTFVPVLELYLDFYYRQVFRTEFPLQVEFWQKFMILILSFFSGLFSKPEYLDMSSLMRRSPLYDMEQKADNPAINAARTIMSQFFTLDKKFEMVKLLIGHFMFVTPQMMEHWKEEPEDYIENELSASQSYNIVASALYAYHRIIKSGDDVAIKSYQLIKECVKDCMNKPESFESVMLKDACYNALGISCGAMNTKPGVDFEDFFMNTIVVDFSRNPHTLLHQRTMQVIDGWAPELIKTKNYSPQIDHASLQMCLTCLGSEDLVVRIFGSIAIGSLLDLIDYDDPEYTKYLTTSVTLIVKLANDMTGSPLAIKVVLDNISLIITSLAEKIEPFAEQIILSMGSLWSVSQNKGLVLGSIVKIMTELVSAIPGCVVVLDSQLVEILVYCCDTKNIHSVALLDPGLVLWKAMLQQSHTLSPNLITLFSFIENLFKENKSDRHTTKALLEILQWYIIVGNAPFINPNISIVVDCLLSTLSVKTDNTVLVNALDTCHCLVMMFPNESPPVLSDVLKEILTSLVRYKNNPKFKATFFRGMALFCRIMVTNKDFFFQFWDQINEPIENFMDLLLNCLKVEDVVYVNLRNIFIVTLSLLLTIPDQRITKYTIAIIEKCVEFIQKNACNPSKPLPLNTVSPAALIKQKIEETQVFHNIDDIGFLKQKIEECINTNGQNALEAIRSGLKQSSLTFLNFQ